MKLALICVDYVSGSPQLGLGYLASYLRKYGEFNDIVVIDKEDPIKAVKREKPDVVGISSVTVMFPEATRVAAEIKKGFDIPTIVGGVHISLIPSSLPKAFDIGVVGEGEQTLLELMQTFERNGGFEKNELKKINGLVFHDRGKLKRTRPRDFIKPLDKIPFPARDLFKLNEYYLTPRNVPQVVGRLTIGTHMFTSRGCPYHCVFCSSSKFWKIVRMNSPEYVVNEMKEIVENYKVESISIWDDLFLTSKERVKKIAELVRKEGLHKEIEFACFGRANLITADICKTLKNMNLNTVSFGFESGSERILNFLKNGTVTIKDNENAVKCCRKYGIKISGTFMVGNPFETKEDIMKTRDFIINNKIDQSLVYILTPFPATKVWNIAKKRGTVNDKINWDRLNLGVAGEDETFFLPKDMSRDEFLKLYKEIRNIGRVEEWKKYKLNLKYLFKPSVIKKVIRRRRDVYKFVKAKARNLLSS